jgi:phosphatidylserine/phosphatidylglycerophosphate/cardiolipin synthase-like enzyme
MAKFITTKQINSELEALILKADERLYIISPYLKLSKDFRELLTYRNSNRKDTKIIFGKQELNPEQMTFLQGLRFVYLFFSEDLHAKCYINDSKAIITSMNLYDFSMINNKEMGILIDTDNPEDVPIYNDAWTQIIYIEKTGKPFDFISKPIEIPIIKDSRKDNVIESVKVQDSKLQNEKYVSASAMAKEFGISREAMHSKLAQKKWIEVQNHDWVLTTSGKNRGAKIKESQYGKYIAWPKSVINEIK